MFDSATTTEAKPHTKAGPHSCLYHIIWFLAWNSLPLHGMGRLLSIDYGRRRTGIAVTDPLRIVASGLTTVPTHTLTQFLKDYMSRETVDAIIVGLPTDMHGRESESMRYIKPAVNRLKADFPSVDIIFYDERFTSVLAHRAMIDGGMKKSERRNNKGIVDEISATILLNDYLQSNQSR